MPSIRGFQAPPRLRRNIAAGGRRFISRQLRGNSGSQPYYGNVTDVGVGSSIAVYATDTFTRTSSSGWGTTETGGYTWTSTGGVATDWTISGNQALVSVTASSARRMLLGASIADAELQFSFSFPIALPASALQFYVIGRFQDANNYLRAQMQLNTAGALQMQPQQVVGGTATNATGFGLVTLYGNGAYPANQKVWVKLRLQGTTIALKSWVDGTAEPAYDGTTSVGNFASMAPATISDATAVSWTNGDWGVGNFLGSAVTFPVTVTQDDMNFQTNNVVPGVISSVGLAAGPAVTSNDVSIGSNVTVFIALGITNTDVSIGSSVATTPAPVIASTGATIGSSVAITAAPLVTSTGATVDSAVAVAAAPAVSSVGATIGSSVSVRAAPVVTSTGATIGSSVAITAAPAVTSAGATVGSSVAVGSAPVVTSTGATVGSSVAVTPALSVTSTGATIGSSVLITAAPVVSSTGATITDTVSATKQSGGANVTDTGATITSTVQLATGRAVTSSGATVGSSVSTTAAPTVTSTGVTVGSSVAITAAPGVTSTGAVIGSSVTPTAVPTITTTGATVGSTVSILAAPAGITSTGAVISDAVQPGFGRAVRSNAFGEWIDTFSGTSSSGLVDPPLGAFAYNSGKATWSEGSGIATQTDTISATRSATTPAAYPHADGDFYLDFMWDTDPVGASQQARMNLRCQGQDPANCYRIVVAKPVGAQATLLVSTVVANTPANTSGGAVAIPGDVVAGTWYRIHTRLSGNAIQSTCWAIGLPEPAPQKDITDPSSTFMSGTAVGISAFRGAGNTNLSQIHFDNAYAALAMTDLVGPAVGRAVTSTDVSIGSSVQIAVSRGVTSAGATIGSTVGPAILPVVSSVGATIGSTVLITAAPAVSSTGATIGSSVAITAAPVITSVGVTIGSAVTTGPTIGVTSSGSVIDSSVQVAVAPSVASTGATIDSTVAAVVAPTITSIGATVDSAVQRAITPAITSTGATVGSSVSAAGGSTTSTGATITSSVAVGVARQGIYSQGAFMGLQHYATDTFTRTNASGWGTTEFGSYAWTKSGTAATDSTDSAHGLMQATATGIHREVLGGVFGDFDTLASITWPVSAPTGGSLSAYILGMYQSSTNNMRLRCTLQTTGAVVLAIEAVVAGSVSSFGGAIITLYGSGGYVAGQNLWLRFRRVQGQYEGKVWVDGTSEPTAIPGFAGQITGSYAYVGLANVNDPVAAGWTSGDIGLEMNASSGISLPITEQWDDFDVTNAQTGATDSVVATNTAGQRGVTDVGATIGSIIQRVAEPVVTSSDVAIGSSVTAVKSNISDVGATIGSTVTLVQGRAIVDEGISQLHVYLLDTFTRAPISGSWGPSSDVNVWASPTSNPSAFSTNGSQGVISYTSGTTYRIFLGQFRTDWETRYQFAFPVSQANGASLQLFVPLRVQGNTNMLRGQVVLTTAGALGVQVQSLVAGVASSVGIGSVQNALNAGGYIAGEVWWASARVIGNGATMEVSAKIWRDGTPEPAYDDANLTGSHATDSTVWSAGVTDPTAQSWTVGDSGLVFTAGAGNPNGDFVIDNALARTPIFFNDFVQSGVATGGIRMPVTSVGATITSSVGIAAAPVVTSVGATVGSTITPRAARPVTETGAAITSSVQPTTTPQITDTGAVITSSVQRGVTAPVTSVGATIDSVAAPTLGPVNAVSDVGATITSSVGRVLAPVVSSAGATITDTVRTPIRRDVPIISTGATITSAVPLLATLVNIYDVGVNVTSTVATAAGTVRAITTTGATITDFTLRRTVTRAVTSTGATVASSVRSTPLQVNSVSTGVTIGSTVSVTPTRGLGPTSVGAAITSTVGVSILRSEPFFYITDVGATIGSHVVTFWRGPARITSGRTGVAPLTHAATSSLARSGHTSVAETITGQTSVTLLMQSRTGLTLTTRQRTGVSPIEPGTTAVSPLSSGAVRR